MYPVCGGGIGGGIPANAPGGNWGIGKYTGGIAIRGKGGGGSAPMSGAIWRAAAAAA